MSNAVLPSFPGKTPEVTRRPEWSTTSKTSVSGREFPTANWSYPRYFYKLSYEFLRQGQGMGLSHTELADLAGFFNARQGSFDSFLFTDPNDNSVTVQVIGNGTGALLQFQLVRTFGGFVEPVFDVNGPAQIFVNGVLQTLTTHYTLSASGLVTFVTAPGDGLAVTWSGSYFRRVRFVQDVADFQKFMSNLWNLKTLEFRSVKP